MTRLTERGLERIQKRQKRAIAARSARQSKKPTSARLDGLGAGKRPKLAKALPLKVKSVPMSEAKLMHNIRELAELRGWLIYHTHRSDRSDPGFPDLVLIRGNCLAFVELKSKDGIVSDDQDIWLTTLRKTGLALYAWVWRPVDWYSGLIETFLK